MADPFEKENRKFLHDIATPISILKLVVKRLAEIQDGTATEKVKGMGPEYVLKALKAVASLEGLHAEYKIELTNRSEENQETKKAS